MRTYCWSFLGLLRNDDKDVPREYKLALGALNDGNTPSDLRAILAAKKMHKEVSEAVNELGGHLVPTNNALASAALKTANEFLDQLPGSTIMQVNKVHFLSRLGLWSELRPYLEDVARMTSNQVSIFTGDLESKGPFPAPGGQRLVEGAHFVVQNLLDVHLAMSYSRSLVFSNQLDVAKLLLLDASGSNLPVDEEGQKHWNRWRAQEISNVFIVDNRLTEVLEPTDISYYELQKCVDIEWGTIFPSDPKTAQGELLAYFHARKCILEYERMASCNEWELKVEDFDNANRLAKEILSAHGYSLRGPLDTQKPFPDERATQTIVDLLGARAKVLSRVGGMHGDAWKDYAFLLQLATNKKYGLRWQEMAFYKQQVEAHLKACSDEEMLDFQQQDEEVNKPLPEQPLKRVKRLVNLQKVKYHSDQNRCKAWCDLVIHRLDAIVAKRAGSS